MSLFASDYSPVATPGSVSPATSDPLSKQGNGKSLALGPDGEKHEEPISNIDKLTGLPTPPRSPPNNPTPAMSERNNSDGSGSGSGSGSNSGSGGGGTIKSLGKTTSSKSSATLMELDSDPLDKPYVATRKATGYNTYEGCMEGKSIHTHLYVETDDRWDGTRGEIKDIPSRY